MKRLRKATGNKELVSQAQLDAKDTKPSQLAYDTLVRPIVLFKEPILLVFNIYLSLIYGILYLWFELFPRIFAGVHGFNPGASGLAFMGVFVGAWGACVAYCLYCKFRLFPLFDKNDGVLPCPEIRLSPARIAVFTLPIAMFGTITGAYSSIHWIVPVIMTGFFGVGAFSLFQVVFGYFGDTYYAEVGAVLVGNDFARSTFGAAFPLFAGAMITRLGIQGTSALLGGLVTLFVPAPFLFMKYGEHLRNASKYATHGSGWDAAKAGGWRGGI